MGLQVGLHLPRRQILHTQRCIGCVLSQAQTPHLQLRQLPQLLQGVGCIKLHIECLQPQPRLARGVCHGQPLPLRRTTHAQRRCAIGQLGKVHAQAGGQLARFQAQGQAAGPISLKLGQVELVELDLQRAAVRLGKGQAAPLQRQGRAIHHRRQGRQHKHIGLVRQAGDKRQTERHRLGRVPNALGAVVEHQLAVRDLDVVQ